MHVLATALTTKEMGLGMNKPAFKNVITNGLLLASDGRKLSKRLKNYTPPEEIIKKFGADTLRFFLLTSTAVGEDYLVADKRIEETYRQTISTLWHTFSFFKTYTDKTFKPNKNFQPEEVLDRWILSRLNDTVLVMTEAMEKYDLTEGGRPIISFVDDLSNWYVRRSRRRFQKPEKKGEKNEAAQTLYLTLLTLAKLVAPFIPFLAEEIYLGLKKARMAESVHLCDWPQWDKKLINKKLEEKMGQLRQVVAQALAQRAAAGLKVRQPLGALKIKNQALSRDKELLELIKDEINVKAVVFDENLKGGEVKLDTKITKELKAEGLAREIVRSLQEMRKEAGLARKDTIFVAFAASEKLIKDAFANFG
ncbi:MAG: class I tRNA ligase family protein, partial [bacterium]|nr:class I tRNA ligase family protein [bacterium]